MENNRPKYPTIKISKKINAYSIDIMLILIANKFMTWGYSLFLKSFMFFLPSEMLQNILNNINSINYLSIWTVFIGHFLVSYYLGDGKTIGKMTYGLKVVPLSDMTKPLSFRQCSLRTLAHLSNILLLFIPSAITYLMTSGKRGTCEVLSKTLVISQVDWEDHCKNEQEKKLSQNLSQQLILFKVKS